jgi:hypothetical protein
MKIVRIICLLFIMAAIFTAAAYAAETNFTASSLTAKDVDCKKWLARKEMRLALKI